MKNRYKMLWVALLVVMPSTVQAQPAGWVEWKEGGITLKLPDGWTSSSTDKVFTVKSGDGEFIFTVAFSPAKTHKEALDLMVKRFKATHTDAKTVQPYQAVFYDTRWPLAGTGVTGTLNGKPMKHEFMATTDKKRRVLIARYGGTKAAYDKNSSAWVKLSRKIRRIGWREARRVRASRRVTVAGQYHRCRISAGIRRPKCDKRLYTGTGITPDSDGRYKKCAFKKGHKKKCGLFNGNAGVPGRNGYDKCRFFAGKITQDGRGGSSCKGMPWSGVLILKK